MSTPGAADFDCDAPLHAAHTPPASWYTSSSFAELERRRVFQGSWQLVARAEQLVGAGSFVSGLLPGLPWMVVRDGATLRAFHNVCRHKATPVAVGQGRCETLVCPYHGWSYGLDGALIRAPRMGKVEGFSRAEFSLRPMGIWVWGPLVFVHADPGAAPPGVAGLTERMGFSDLVWHSRRTYEIACNWKVFADNYLDGGYHISHMHKTLDGLLDMDSYSTTLHEGFSVQGVGADPAHSARMGEEALYVWLFPNTMLNRYGPCLDTNQVLPTGPESCVVHFDFWFAGGTDPEAIAKSIEGSHGTQLEDVTISEWVQQGLSSPSYDRSRYAAVEKGIHHFHQLLAAAIR